MTKSELIEFLAERQRLPKGRAEQVVDCVFDALVAALRAGERIEIRGFGSFELRHYRAYAGRNPRTGAAVAVAPKVLPFFKVGKDLRERIDRGRAHEPVAERQTNPARPRHDSEAARERALYGDATHPEEPPG